ncbi:MAG: HPr family phosphocarrier protein [Lachnospiraceae bacterium]|nr:HPr family phosphocarrier protein [Robinsoniella sp.]MDY3765197.1 HPr family phosphocarrier protein [Lachnospiraceae bacterium]
MVSQKVVVKNLKGLHIRPVTEMCNQAAKYKSIITFTVGDKTVNAKSLLSVLSAKVHCGAEIEFVCEGTDEEEALRKMIEIIEQGLGERIDGEETLS